MSFSKRLTEPGHLPIATDGNQRAHLIFAMGAQPALTYHGANSKATLILTLSHTTAPVASSPPASTPLPSPSPPLAPPLLNATLDPPPSLPLPVSPPLQSESLSEMLGTLPFEVSAGMTALYIGGGALVCLCCCCCCLAVLCFRRCRRRADASACS